MRRPRRNHSAAFKAKVALEEVLGELPLAKLAEKYDVHATQIAQWKADLVKGAKAVFDGKKPDKPDIDVQRLHAKICELALANDFLESVFIKAGKMSVRKRSTRYTNFQLAGMFKGQSTLRVKRAEGRIFSGSGLISLINDEIRMLPQLR